MPYKGKEMQDISVKEEEKEKRKGNGGRKE
jgi:hypothetical protein